ncbi:MAG: proline dehydrogenase family protein [Polyangiales bacterium]
MSEPQASGPVLRARELLDRVRGCELSEQQLSDRSVDLAALLAEAAEQHKRRADRERDALLAGLMGDAHGQVLTTLLTDRVVRSRDPDKTVDAARHLLRRLGVPRYLPGVARLQLRALLHLGPFVPQIAARGLLERLRTEARRVVLAAEDPDLGNYLALRRQEGVRVNVNHLGEAVLGETEARARVADYIALLSRPDVESISVKISSIYSQVDLLAWDTTLERLAERLRPIYRVALEHLYARPSGVSTPKLVNLDMESYRDLRLTLELFRRLLDEPELRALTAGVVLQAYLPDSLPLQRELTDFATERVRRGGAPIRLRIVKGANLLAERAEAALRGWEVPVLLSKAEVDASYKQMLEHGCRPEHAAAVQLGIASHNLFDLAFGMVLRANRGVEAAVGFELLEGMADHVRRVIIAVAGDCLVYAPLCEASALQSAIAYLMRRLDENTAEENFLRHSFGMRPGDAAWIAQQGRFLDAFRTRHVLAHAPRRTQDRREPPTAIPPGEFANEPDTDFSLAHNRAWIVALLEREQARPCFDVPLQVAGTERAGEPRMDGCDPSRPGHVPYRFALATADDIAAALQAGVRAAEGFARVGLDERAQMLGEVALQLRSRRGELIAAMALDAGKRVDQADAEVSEAIDFAEYYAESFAALAGAHPEIELQPKGLVLVTPPWNFPLAIPAGGVLAALAAGNAVILKPALETVHVAERLARACWDAGVPKALLQLVACTDDLGSTLVSDPRVSQVVLTGATATAKRFCELRPGIPLAAETGGKNAIIVTATADRDEAIKDAVASAFGHAGQKCSACSLLICEAEVYDDSRLLRALADAAESLHVGPSWDPRSVVTPLIRPPEGPLLRALTTLDEGETWLLEPRRDLRNPRLWSPAIKLGVREGSFMHVTELFGPVLAVMRADDLDHALRLANGTPYGLTAGLHSLNEREQQRFSERMDAGNLYVNKPVTGAIVRRQPFGGFKASCVGPGAKAGGPNYAAQLAHVIQRAPPAIVCPPDARVAELIGAARPHLRELERQRLGIGACSYEHARRTYFGLDHDPSSVLGERNVLRYVPCAPMLLRASAQAEATDLLLACSAALTAHASFELSVHPATARAMPYLSRFPGLRVRVEDAEGCARSLTPDLVRVRAVGDIEPELLAAAEPLLLYVATEPVLLSGRFELLRYLREQSISHRYHRYGNLAPAELLPPLRTSPA